MTVHDNSNLQHHDDVQQVQHDTNSDEDNSDHFQGGRHKYFKTGIGPGGLVDHNSHPNCELNGFHYHTRYKVASIILLQSRHPQVGERSIEHAAPEKYDAHHGIGDYHAGGKALRSISWRRMRQRGPMMREVAKSVSINSKREDFSRNEAEISVND